MVDGPVPTDIDGRYPFRRMNEGLADGGGTRRIAYHIVRAIIDAMSKKRATGISFPRLLKMAK